MFIEEDLNADNANTCNYNYTIQFLKCIILIMLKCTLIGYLYIPCQIASSYIASNGTAI